MTAEEFRKMALSLPETSEAAHMGHPDFRVEGRSSRHSARRDKKVQLRAAKKTTLRSALVSAWRNRAPKRLMQDFDVE